MRICKTCNLNLDRSRFADNRKICKKCRNKTKGDSIRKRIASGEMDFDVRLNHWMNQTRLKDGRRHLSKSFLKEKAMEALEKFPYIRFLHKCPGVGQKNNSYHPFSASLDKIDPKLGYDEDNVQVIPMWLNEAKLNSSMEELIPLLRDFIDNYTEFKTYLKEIITGGPSA